MSDEVVAMTITDRLVLVGTNMLDPVTHINHTHLPHSVFPGFEVVRNGWDPEQMKRNKRKMVPLDKQLNWMQMTRGGKTMKMVQQLTVNRLKRTTSSLNFLVGCWRTDYCFHYCQLLCCDLVLILITSSTIRLFLFSSYFP